ncbi:hypothetical protein BXT84_14045 [Sulfobacillus thermotolerans]|uniref:NrS-1 polymerase-like helicase domain-containing protein n=1 Tax=Sulfobacillus thermotolerans TaxID=338644 RepID=A0ABN5H2N3_9FIRM|nr:hypothetical protein BXT84_14045 [Sulfobacillus thermotolerans]
MSMSEEKFQQIIHEHLLKMNGSLEDRRQLLMDNGQALLNQVWNVFRDTGKPEVFYDTSVIQALAQIKVSVDSETAFYKHFAPILRELQQRKMPIKPLKQDIQNAAKHLWSLTKESSDVDSLTKNPPLALWNDDDEQFVTATIRANFVRDEQISEDAQKTKTVIEFTKIAQFLIDRYHLISANGEIYGLVNLQNLFGKILGYADEDTGRLGRLLIRVFSTLDFPDSETIAKKILKHIRMLLPIPSRNEIPDINTYPDVPWGNISFDIDHHQTTTLRARHKDVTAHDRTLVDAMFHRFPLSDDAIFAIKVFVGYALFPTHHQWQRALILAAPQGSNGKSTLLSIISQIFHPEDVTHVTFQAFAKNPLYAAAALSTGTVNIVTDMAGSFINEDAIGYVRQAISGEAMDAREIYGRPFSFVPRSKWLMATNRLPGTTDSSNALNRRLYVVAMHSQTFAEGKNLLAEYSTQEFIDALANVCVETYLNWIAHHETLPEITSSKEFQEEQRIANDAIYALFDVDGIFIRDEHAQINAKDAYKKYKEYILANEDLLRYGNVKIIGEKSFSRRIEELGFLKKRASTGSRPYYFEGFRLRKAEEFDRAIVYEEEDEPNPLDVISEDDDLDLC